MSRPTVSNEDKFRGYPRALVACACDGCAEQQTYPVDMLHWLDGDNIEGGDEPGWYCENCYDELWVPEHEHQEFDRGETLAAFM